MYKSSVSNTSRVIFIAVILIIVATTLPVFFSNDFHALLIVTLINGITLLLLLWVIFKTNYTIDKSYLICKSGPFKKKIKIQSISKISYHKGIIVPSFWKFSLNHYGLIINYQKFEDVYISPKDEIDFIAELTQINPNIIIVESK